MTVNIVKGYRPGSIGRIAELHGVYYHRHAGFGLYFEGKVATELSQFLGRYREESDGLWLALDDQQIEGSIVIDGADANGSAHLRWYVVSDRLRGSGVGEMLLFDALEFCRARRYRSVYLWTFEGLHAARHLYEKHGFRLAHEQKGKQWGTEVTEQRFELTLSA